jgi:hypothetical protein
MKNLIFTFAFLLLSSSVIFSQFVDENFNYASGDSLQQHGWNTIGSVYTNRLTVTSPGLDFPAYVNSGIGNAVTVDTTGQDVFKDFTSPKSSGNVYASFLVNVKSAKSNGDYFTAFLSSTNSNSFAGRVFVKDSSGKIAFGLSKTTETVLYTPAVYSKDSTYLMVLKYSINPGTVNDSVSLFVFSASENVPVFEPAATLGPKGASGADLTDAGRISLRQGSASAAPKIILDGIFIADSWDNSALPVELNSFTSNVINSCVELFWSTASETNNESFEIERLASETGFNSNGDWLKAGKVSGHGTSNSVISYNFTDKNLNTGNYFYRLKQMDFNGNFEYFYLNNEISIGTPVKFNLFQNYPNPFNPSTKINFEIPAEGFVSLKVYNSSGKEVESMLNEFKTPGYYSVDFNGSDLSSGIYFYSLSSVSEGSRFYSVKKMILLK